MPPPQTRLTLEGIQEIETKRAATLSELHSAIVQEVRNAKVWDNAWTLFTDYLCPAIIMSQERLQQQEQGHGRLTLSENDIRMIQYSISAMVRYAPSTAESNAVYVFFLQQCVPPIRDDPTINNCLVSLIYQYAQAKDLEIQARGLDLVKIALDRGVGLPSYSAHSSAHDHPRHQRFAPENSHKEHILVSVSRPILKLHHMRISADGTTLEPTGPGGAGEGAQRRNTSSSSRKQNRGDAPSSPKANNKAEGKHKEPKEEDGEGLKEVKEPKEVRDAKEPKEKKRDAKASKDNKDKGNNKDKDNTQQQAPRPKRQPKLRQEGEQPTSTDAGASVSSSSTPSSPSSSPNNTRSHHRNSKAENAHSSNNKSPQQKPQESNNNKKSNRPNSPPKPSNDKKEKDEKKEPRSGLRSGGRAAFAGADRNNNNNRNSRDKETCSSSGRSSPRQILFVPASTNPKSDDSSSTTSAAADVAAAGSASTSSASSPKRSSSRRTGAKKARESTDAKESSGSGSLAKDMENLKLDSAPIQA
ncbi:hypothetical protein BG005_003244 [Podila minutissima]|nr:hypothetical protein BG005_003244 [Podila minutissima]